LRYRISAVFPRGRKRQIDAGEKGRRGELIEEEASSFPLLLLLLFRTSWTEGGLIAGKGKRFYLCPLLPLRQSRASSASRASAAGGLIRTVLCASQKKQKLKREETESEREPKRKNAAGAASSSS
jgi:hypothetical protein